MTEAELNSSVQAILRHYGLKHAGVSRISTGHINSTYLISTGNNGRYVLQHLNPIFPPEVNINIEIITTHLSAKGLLTPRLVRTQKDQLWLEEKGQTWRLLTYIEGDIYTKLEEPHSAKEAGSLLGRFHMNLLDLADPVKNLRPAIHNLKTHIQTLERTVKEKINHPQYGAVSKVANEILGLVQNLPELAATQFRIVHGDPKITNIIFNKDSHQARCFIDLDTIAKMPLYLELGDAMRSWCNPNGEDTLDGVFSMELFEAAIEGYAERTQTFITKEEWTNIVSATKNIFIELATRFCTDALNENYFAWDSNRFPSHSEHNRVRAISQLTAVKSLIEQEKLAEELVRDYFAK